MSGDLPPILQEHQAERSYGRQLVEKLALGLLDREGVEQVGELDPVTHDPVGRLVFQGFAHEQAIVGAIEIDHSFGGARQAVGQGLDEPRLMNAKRARRSVCFSLCSGRRVSRLDFWLIFAPFMANA